MMDFNNKVIKLKDLESQAIQEAIVSCHNIAAAARALGISRATIYRKIKLYGIDKARKTVILGVK